MFYHTTYTPKLPEYVVDLGEGFKTKTKNKDHLTKHGLMEVDILTFVNKLCVLVDTKKDEIPADEWNTLKNTLAHLVVSYDGELYYYLLHAHGADALNYNAWVHFSYDSSWPVCVRTFTDMPTDVLEQYALKAWAVRNRTLGDDGRKAVMQAISKRTDIYGTESLPIEMVERILFES
jgi:hypothetical protein